MKVTPLEKKAFIFLIFQKKKETLSGQSLKLEVLK